jgi:undecaprenyl diphosphate synthase
LSSLPTHIGIIMDGNGRWATARHLPRTAGHKQGITTAKKIIREAIRLGIPYLTLYVFSTENWKRTESEVGFLMSLIIHHMKTDFSFYVDNRIRIRHTGDLEGLPSDVQEVIRKSIQDTVDNDAITVNLAVNYGGRDEIIRAVNRWAESTDGLSEPFSEETMTIYLDNGDLPDPDLIIRSAGELRISNFLLWESAYAEIYISEKLWPDFTEDDLQDAIQNFSRRKRKFGGIK